MEQASNLRLTIRSMVLLGTLLISGLLSGCWTEKETLKGGSETRSQTFTLGGGFFVPASYTYHREETRNIK